MPLASSSSYKPMLPRVKLRRITSAQTVATGTQVPVSWNSADYNPSGMWSSGANITIPHHGIYLVTGVIEWQGSTGGTFRSIFINPSSSEVEGITVAHAGVSGGTSFATRVNMHWIGELDPSIDATIGIEGSHNAGINLNMQVNRTYIAVQMLRWL